MPQPKADPDWFAAQFRSSRPIALNRCRSRTNAPHAACEDAVDHAFLKAWKNNYEYPNDKAFLAWLVQASVNFVIDLKRKAETHLRMIELLERLMRSAGSGGPSGDRDLKVSRVRESLESLSPDHRAVLVKHYFHGRTDQEVADEIGLNRLRVFRLREKALEQLKRAYEGRDRGSFAGSPTPEG